MNFRKTALTACFLAATFPSGVQLNASSTNDDELEMMEQGIRRAPHVLPQGSHIGARDDDQPNRIAHSIMHKVNVVGYVVSGVLKGPLGFVSIGCSAAAGFLSAIGQEGAVPYLAGASAALSAVVLWLNYTHLKKEKDLNNELRRDVTVKERERQDWQQEATRLKRRKEEYKRNVQSVQHQETRRLLQENEALRGRLSHLGVLDEDDDLGFRPLRERTVHGHNFGLSEERKKSDLPSLKDKKKSRKDKGKKKDKKEKGEKTTSADVRSSLLHPSPVEEDHSGSETD